MSYTLYIDESGEEGLTNIRTETTPGASPWLVFGAALIKDDDYDEAIEKIQFIEESINLRALHFSNIRQHKKKVFSFKEIAKLDAVFFGTASNKQSASQTNYTPYIESESWKYYNKNVQYLLELVGNYFQENNIGIDDHRIFFEKKRGVRYDSMKNFFRTIARNPHRNHMRSFQILNINSITAKEKNEDNAFKIADGVAHAIFQCCENNDFGIRETRYLNEIKNNFHSGENNEILDYGLKAINTVRDLNLCVESHRFLTSLNSSNEEQLAA